MRYLTEYKNISNEVKEFAMHVYRTILNDSKRQPKQFSRNNSLTFVENTICLTANNTQKWIFTNIDGLDVTYILYYVDTAGEYNMAMRYVGASANSQSDYDDRTMTIVSGIIEGCPSPDMLGTISHEVNHLYEYDNGREKRIDLYDRMIKLTQQATTNRIAYNVGRALYYTFPHEIDAFAHQYYGFLCQEQPMHLKFEETLKYSEYAMAEAYVDFIIKNKTNIEVIKYVNYLGYKMRSFVKRLKFALKKMYAKMHNAYVRFTSEQTPMTEGRMHQLSRIDRRWLEECQKYDEEIKWGCESIYNFDGN